MDFASNRSEEIRTWDSSCSAVLNGEFYIFGDFYSHSWLSDHEDAKKRSRSIKKIINCGLELTDELTFDFIDGTCGTFFFPDERVLLCFDQNNSKKCRR